MDNVTLILSSLLSIAMLILIAPNILRFNQGKILRNIALWLAIFCGLALAYQVIGPEKIRGKPITQSVLTNPVGGEESSTIEKDSGIPETVTDDAPQGYNPPR